MKGLNTLNVDWVNAIYEKTNIGITACLDIMLALLSITLAVQIMKAFGNPSHQGGPNYGPVLAGFFAMSFLMVYVEVMDLFSETITAIVNMYPDSDPLKNIQVITDNYLKKQEAAQAAKAAAGGGFFDFMPTMEEAKNLFTYLLLLIEQGTLSSIRVAMELFQMVLLSILFATGPFAIALSVIPGFHPVLGHWFKKWIQINFWSVTFCVLDSIVMAFNLGSANDFESAGYAFGTTQINALLMNVILIICYLMVPYITSLYLGALGDAGVGFMAKMVGTGAAAASFATGGVSGLHGAVSGVPNLPGGGGGGNSGGGSGSPSAASASPIYADSSSYAAAGSGQQNVYASNGTRSLPQQPKYDEYETADVVYV